MPLVFTESFGHYSTQAQLTTKWGTVLFGETLLSTASQQGLEHRPVNLPLDYVGNSYLYYGQVLETDPNTSAAWTLTGLNAAEFGWQVIS